MVGRSFGATVLSLLGCIAFLASGNTEKKSSCTQKCNNKTQEMRRIGWIRGLASTSTSTSISNVNVYGRTRHLATISEFLRDHKPNTRHGGALFMLQQMLLFSLQNPSGVHSDFSIKRSFHATRLLLSPDTNLYATLGVSKDASRDDIKKAFHMLAKKYHPDANKNNPAAKRKFQEIRDAYETLRDPEQRAQYDEEYIRGTSQKEYTRGTTWRQYATREAEGFPGASQEQFSYSFHKIFSEIFENEIDDSAADIQVDLPLSFSEAANGCTKQLKFDSNVPCDSCDGRGYPISAKPKVCPVCRGAGKVTVLPFTSTCSTCKGFGRIIKDNCKACRGFGVVQGVKEVKVTIPTGVESGDTIHVPKAGHSGGQGIQPGTLYIKLKVAEDPTFRRQGVDIYVDCHINFTQAILGGSVDVPTLSGKTQVKIPEGVQPGQLLVLRGRGFVKQGGFLESYGDQYVRFYVDFPTMLNERQRALLEEFAKEECNLGNNGSGENWWQQFVDRLTASKFMIEIGFFMLVLLVLGRII